MNEAVQTPKQRREAAERTPDQSPEPQGRLVLLPTRVPPPTDTSAVPPHEPPPEENREAIRRKIRMLIQQFRHIPGPIRASVRQALADAHQADKREEAERDRYLDAATEFRKLDRELVKAAATFERAIFRCGLYPLAERIALSEKISYLARFIGSGLGGRASAGTAFGRCYELTATSKGAQWGPYTAQAVRDVVEQVQSVLARRRRSWGRTRALELARQYVGLLCMDLDILPLDTGKRLTRKRMSELVRARLKRSSELLHAAETRDGVAEELTAAQLHTIAHGQGYLLERFRTMCAQLTQPNRRMLPPPDQPAMFIRDERLLGSSEPNTPTPGTPEQS